MIVYVESNFLLEIALRQEQVTSAEKILNLAQCEKISLVIPTFALAEPYWTLRKNGDVRRRLCNEVEREIRQLSRSLQHSSFTPQASDVVNQLAQIESYERRSLDEIIGKILEVAEIVQMDSQTISACLQDTDNLALQPQDAFIFSSVLRHLKSANQLEEKLFISRNSKDFGDYAVIDQLKTFGCQYLASFLDATAFLEAKLKSL